VRGHVLVWPSLKRMPPEIAKLRDDPTALKAAVDHHITSLVTKYRGRLPEWDVVNEPFTNRDLEEILGRDAFVDWFKLARAADPQARLFINDYGIIETANRLNTDHQKHYEDFIQYLLSHGAPVDAIGIQGHFGAAVTNPQIMLDTLDRFAKFGKPIRITELDVNMLDPELQAKFLRDVFIVCFSHPAVDGILQWGFWEGRHWIPDAALYDRNWNLRPHGQAFQSLMNEWKTDVTAITGTDGTVTIRGFIGDYTIQSNSVQKAASLTREGSSVELSIDR
jgi:endo-1,4-beta-xylanase